MGALRATLLVSSVCRPPVPRPSTPPLRGGRLSESLLLARPFAAPAVLAITTGLRVGMAPDTDGSHAASSPSPRPVRGRRRRRDRRTPELFVVGELVPQCPPPADAVQTRRALAAALRADRTLGRGGLAMAMAPSRLSVARLAGPSAPLAAALRPPPANATKSYAKPNKKPVESNLCSTFGIAFSPCGWLGHQAGTPCPRRIVLHPRLIGWRITQNWFQRRQGLCRWPPPPPRPGATLLRPRHPGRTALTIRRARSRGPLATLRLNYPCCPDQPRHSPNAGFMISEFVWSWGRRARAGRQKKQAQPSYHRLTKRCLAPGLTLSRRCPGRARRYQCPADDGNGRRRTSARPPALPPPRPSPGLVVPRGVMPGRYTLGRG